MTTRDEKQQQQQQQQQQYMRGLNSSQQIESSLLPSTSTQQLPMFIITGFGPFGNVTENPTTVIVRELQTYLHQHNNNITTWTCNDNDNDETINNEDNNSNENKTYNVKDLIHDCILLETSAEDVCRVMNEIKDKLIDISKKCQQSTSSSSSQQQQQQNQKRKKVILLHLGVNENSKCFEIESCAYNEATFRIADQKGYQPNKQSIFHKEQFGQCYTTNINNIQSIAVNMKQLYPNIDTKISTDPGRYVCNYVYCYSLQQFQNTNDDDDNNDNNNSNNNNNNIANNIHHYIDCQSLFLHVPPFHVISKQDQFKYITSLLKELSLT